MMTQASLSRRTFLKSTSALSGTVALPWVMTVSKVAARSFKIGLIGCGGRGQGAVVDALEAAQTLNFQVEVVAVADYFQDRADRAGKRFGVPPQRCFGGPKAYRALLETDVQIVLIATAPVFHPLFLEAAVKAGKHVFLEKPVAVDPVGCRRVIAAAEEGFRKGLVLVAGTDMRHDWNFRLTHQAVAVEKALGRLYAGRVSYCIGSMFRTQPIEPKSADDLVRTWQNWVALSGDHLVEQHVHNIDIANWFCGRPPLSAVGFGGRARRNAGDMYDFFSIDYDYGDGVHIHSMCRQVNGCYNWVGHDFVYEKGHTSGSDYPNPKTSPIPPDLPRGKSPHHQEQIDTLYLVAKGEPVNQLHALAESTATAIMGRISAYTGKQVFWDEIMTDPNKNPQLFNLQLKPTAEDFENGTVEIPPENVVARPGQPA
ncbi:MAG: Gfo/Idh/MocA family oxidoreductase [Thermoguttaceae bacterium]|nr:Gfo/Idh/MocA family oxidoreductase [Thermoguttaceae bacterium]MDW8078054.1 Gfo/Idh/MocA family oxidoreductase [Thermoguttaceae bacterium]